MIWSIFVLLLSVKQKSLLWKSDYSLEFIFSKPSFEFMLFYFVSAVYEDTYSSKSSISILLTPLWLYGVGLLNDEITIYLFVRRVFELDKFLSNDWDDKNY